MGVLSASRSEAKADFLRLGLAKRTLWPAFLADKAKCEPRLVVGCAAMDQGISTQLYHLKDAKPAKAITFATWILQFVGTVWLIFQVCAGWARGPAWPRLDDLDNPVGMTLRAKLDTWNIAEVTQLLAAITFNRGTWSIAVLGCFLSRYRLAGLYTTTAIAAVFDLVCLARAATIAHDIWVLDSELRVLGTLEYMGSRFCAIFSLIAVALEATVLIYGKRASSIAMQD